MCATLRRKISQSIKKQAIYRFCKLHYYTDDSWEDKWEPFENWSDDDIEEQVKNDVIALKKFMNSQT